MEHSTPPRMMLVPSPMSAEEGIALEEQNLLPWAYPTDDHNDEQFADAPTDEPTHADDTHDHNSHDDSAPMTDDSGPPEDPEVVMEDAVNTLAVYNLQALGVDAVAANRLAARVLRTRPSVVGVIDRGTWGNLQTAGVAN